MANNKGHEMRLIYYMILGLFLIGCKVDNKQIDSKRQQIEFNRVVDSFLSFKFNNIAVVQLESRPIFKRNPFFKGDLDSLKFLPPPPPPTEIIIYTKDFFKVLVEDKIIDKDDAEFMWSHIDSTIIFTIKPDLINRDLITKERLDSLFENDIESGYDSLMTIYNSGQFIRVSTPLFNKDLTKLIISIDYYCGGLCGQGYIFVLAKKNDNWYIVDESFTWTS